MSPLLLTLALVAISSLPFYRPLDDYAKLPKLPTKFSEESSLAVDFRSRSLNFPL